MYFLSFFLPPPLSFLAERPIYQFAESPPLCTHKAFLRSAIVKVFLIHVVRFVDILHSSHLFRIRLQPWTKPRFCRAPLPPTPASGVVSVPIRRPASTLPFRLHSLPRGATSSRFILSLAFCMILLFPCVYCERARRNEQPPV